MNTNTCQQLLASTTLVSWGGDYIDVDAYVKLPNGSEFLQRMYVEKNQPNSLIRDEPRFSESETSEFDDGDVIQCPPEVMAAFDAAVPSARALIETSLQLSTSAPSIRV